MHNSCSFPVIFTIGPSAGPNDYIPWAIIGFTFNYVIRRRYFSWWTRYNCLLFALSISQMRTDDYIINPT